MKLLKQKMLAGVILVCLAVPVQAGPFLALAAWATGSAHCAALLLPQAQLLCAVGAGIYTGIASLIPMP